MILIKLKGGLGNQLFQYAMGRRAVHANKVDLKLDVLSGFTVIQGEAYRSYNLHAFNIIENFASSNEIAKLKKNRFANLIEELKPYHRRLFIKEHQFHFNSKILKLSDNTYIEGYWQSEKYFKDIESIIRQEIVLKKPIANKYENLIHKTNSVSIHIRRGDYVTNKRIREAHGACSLNYYYKAIKKITRAITSPHFFIFSDDINWVKENLKTKHPITFISDNNTKDYEELILMSKCKHNIVANSSFSWWGAWLNNNQDKIVIAPQKWFNNASINTKDLIPESWIKI